MREITIEVTVTKTTKVKKTVKATSKFLNHDLSMAAENLKSDILFGLYDDYSKISIDPQAYDEDGKIMNGVNWDLLNNQ